METNKEFLDTEEVAKTLKVSVRSVRKLFSTGEIKSKKIAGKYFTTAEILKKYIAGEKG